MGLTDVAGVFSRYFIVGFFLPSFFALVVLSQTLTSEALPQVYEKHGDATRIVVLGGAGLLAGLVALGLNYPILRMFEGYPLREARRAPLVGPLYSRLLRRQQNTYRALRAVRDDEAASGEDRGRAAWKLDRQFGEEDQRKLLPLAFGNAVRAFEGHSYSRWGLDSIPVWPRIELLLTEDQRNTVTDTKGETAFFVNASLFAAIVGVILVIDEIVNQPLEWQWLWMYLIPFGVSAVAYRWAIGAAVRWGSVVRAAIDLNRLKLYGDLGIREPTSFTEERGRLASAVNASLLYGSPIPDDLRAPTRSGDREEKRS